MKRIDKLVLVHFRQSECPIWRKNVHTFLRDLASRIYFGGFGLKKLVIRTAISISLFGVIAGCTTPLEQCNATATQEYRTIVAAVNEAQDNVTRGYAVHTTSVPYTVHQTCYRNDPVTFALIPYSCPQTHYRKQSTPVAIDVNQERQKLRRLQAALPELERRAQAGLAQCASQYPKS